MSADTRLRNFSFRLYCNLTMTNTLFLEFIQLFSFSETVKILLLFYYILPWPLSFLDIFHLIILFLFSTHSLSNHGGDFLFLFPLSLSPIILNSLYAPAVLAVSMIILLRDEHMPSILSWVTFDDTFLSCWDKSDNNWLSQTAFWKSTALSIDHLKHIFCKISGSKDIDWESAILCEHWRSTVISHENLNLTRQWTSEKTKQNMDQTFPHQNDLHTGACIHLRSHNL